MDGVCAKKKKRPIAAHEKADQKACVRVCDAGGGDRALCGVLRVRQFRFVFDRV